jgi:hypothetical protein
MNIGQIRQKIARYLQRAEAEFVASGQDLIIEALETARINAERTYAWNAQKTQVQLVVQPSGADIPVATLKTIESAWILQNNEPYPLEVRMQEDYSLRSQKIERTYEYRRYPSDADMINPYRARSKRQLVIHGNRLRIDPALTSNATILLDCQTWMSTYRGAANNYTDWMLTRGHDYLFWAAIIELNHLVKDFVPRQEGNLNPPQQNADRALLTLHELDAFRFAKAIYYP